MYTCICAFPPRAYLGDSAPFAHLKHSGHLIPSLHARATAIEAASCLMLAVIEVFVEHQGWLVPLISARRHRSRVFDSRSLTLVICRNPTPPAAAPVAPAIARHVSRLTSESRANLSANWFFNPVTLSPLRRSSSRKSSRRSIILESRLHHDLCAREGP